MLRWSATAGKAPPSTRSIASNVSRQTFSIIFTRRTLTRFIKFNEFRLGLDRFADLTNVEFRSKFLGFRSTERHRRVSSSVSSRYEDVSDDSLPSSIEWREKDAVVGVNDQGSCAPDAAERSEEEVQLLYEEWLLKHRKSVNALDEKGSRFQVFRDNLKYIDEHNAAADAGEQTFRLGLNRFADLTNDEFRSKFSGFCYTGRHRRVSSSSKNNPLGVKALLRTPAKPNRAFADADGMHSSS